MKSTEDTESDTWILFQELIQATKINENFSSVF